MSNRLPAACGPVLFLLIVGFSHFSAPIAHADTYVGTFPNTFAVTTAWNRPNTECSGGSPGLTTSRYYEVIQVVPAFAGAQINVTATRTGGGAIALDSYQGTFFSTSPCLNRLNSFGQSGSGSVSMSIISLSGGPVTIVVSSGAGSDPGTFTAVLSNFSSEPDCNASGGSLSTSSQAVASGGGTFMTTYTPPASPATCSFWRTSNVPSWITGLPSSGTGPQTLTYTVGSNTTQPPRSGLIGIGESSLSVTQQSSCSYAVAPNPIDVTSPGAVTRTINVTTTPGCTWSTVENASWITVQNGSGTGSGTVTLQLAQNAQDIGAARNATVTVAGVAVSVSQADGPCAYTVPALPNASSAGGNGLTVAVTTTEGCPWTASTTTPWLTTTSSGSGSGSVSYDVAPNTGAVRNGSLTIAGAARALTQLPNCAIVLNTSSATSISGGGGINFNVQTPAGCPFTVTSNAAFITPTTNGNTIHLEVASWNGAMRTGTVTVASTTIASSATFTVTQSSGCVAQLASTMLDVAASGVMTLVQATTTQDCQISSSSTDAWITVGGVTPAGFDVTVAPNVGPARAGTITVLATDAGPQAFTVSQADGCHVTPGTTTGTLTRTGSTGTQSVAASDPTCVNPTVTSSAPWLTCGWSLGTLSYGANANLDATRMGTCSVAFANGEPYVVEVSQLTAIDPPSGISVESIEATVGESPSFVAVGSVGGTSVTYQWLRDGVAIPGAVRSTLGFTAVALTDAGEYRVVVTNVAGSFTSAPATLVVLEAPSQEGGGCTVARDEDGASVLGLLSFAIGVVLTSRRRRSM